MHGWLPGLLAFSVALGAQAQEGFASLNGGTNQQLERIHQ